jgi:4-amino-4-deoxy-L-arabinose transferase-like glycosyltransferase
MIPLITMREMSKRTKVAFLIGIMCLGFLLRLLGLYWGQAYHYAAMGDEMLAYRVAVDLDAGQERAFYIGQPNFKTGKLPGPLWALFWLVGLKIGGSPETVCLMMIILHTCVIYLVYRLAESVFGARYSLWAALFFATCPWPVYYSIFAWNPIPMAFFGALLYLALWNVINQPNSRNIFWVCVLLGIMPQFHMVVMFIVPVVVLLLWWSPSRLNRRWLAVGILASVLLYVPYVIGEMRHGWENTRRILSGRLPASVSVLKILTLPITVLSNLMSSVTGRDLSEYHAFGNACFGSFWILAAFNAVSLILSVVIIGFFLVRLARSLRGKWRSPKRALADAPAEVFVGSLLVFPSLLFVFSLSDFNSRYLIVQFPLLFLLPAVFMVRELDGNRWRGPVRAVMLLTIGFNILLSPAYFHYQGAYIANADYFLPGFRKMESIRQRLKTDAGANYRVRIDDAAYVKTMAKKYADGVKDLAEYVDLRERYDPVTMHASQVKTYHVQAATDLVETNQRVVCATNGIAIVASN